MPSVQYDKFYQTLLSNSFYGDMSLTQVRYGFEKMMAPFPAEADIAMEECLIGKIPATWVHAPQATKERIILFFHGGGYSVGSTASHQDFLGRLSKATGLYVLGIDYRLAPEDPFPAALHDALEAYHFLLHEGYSHEQIIIAGASAGGGLAFSLLYALKEKGEPLPSAVLGLCPWLDLSMSENSIKRNLGKDTLKEERLQTCVNWYLPLEQVLESQFVKKPTVSPLFGDPTGFPPTFLMVGSYELLYDEVAHFAKKLKTCHVPVTLDIGEEMFHCWFMYATQIPEGQEAIERMAKFVSTTKKA